MVNLEKHISEGWTVGDFINEIEPIFDQIQSGNSWIKKFSNDKDSLARLKEFCINLQPYYKKHIPMVFNYFKNKIN